MLSRKFAAYFQNNFSYEHLWTAASDATKEYSLILQLLKFDTDWGFKWFLTEYFKFWIN